jgi:NAD(P)H dehydrogenase (quinone)
MRALVVYCHPLGDSFIAAARDQVLATLRDAGHEVRLTDLYADGFTPELSAWEHTNHLAPAHTKPDIATYAADLAWCDTLIAVYPTWWSGQPAMLKGWIDRVWVAGVAYELPPGASTIRPLLHNIRRIVTVTTHGSSKFVNSLQGEGGKRVMHRSLRVLCHRFTRTTWLALYSIDRATPTQRKAFLRRVERRLRRLR